jgi:hypothetical protein
MVGDDDVSISNEESSTSITVDVDSKEVELYISMPQMMDFNLLRDDEVYDLWRTHKSMFPNLDRMARQFLALPASSAGVERLFNKSGETRGDKRKHMSTLESDLFE